jgi:hypothetical protein
MAESIRGIKNRNISTEATFPTQWLNIYIPKFSPMTPQTYDYNTRDTYKTNWFMWKAPFAGHLQYVQAGCRQFAAANTTCYLEVENNTASMLDSRLDLRGTEGRIAVATVSATNYAFAKDETIHVYVYCSNLDVAKGLSVSLGFRPLVGQETRT